MKYARVVAFVRDHAWAIRPQTLAVMADLIAFRAEGGRLTDDEIHERISAADARGPRSGGAATVPTVAIIPLYGVVSHRASLMSDMSEGGTALERFSAAFQDADRSPQVTSIVLDVDSPGGTADGCAEAAAMIRASSKPVVAVANTEMCSAAYWIASAADEIWATPSAMYVGNIGVFSVHQDVSKMAEDLGVKMTLFRAGRYKAEENPYEPLTDDAKAHMQELVDDAYGLFVADVAKGRGVSVSDVRDGYGEGRALPAKRALAAGLIDRIGTLDEAIARAGSGRVKPRGAKAEGGYRLVALEGLPDLEVDPDRIASASIDASAIAEGQVTIDPQGIVLPDGQFAEADAAARAEVELARARHDYMTRTR